jgi:hypothetical protein
MKKIFLLLFFTFIFSFNLYSHGFTLSDHSQIKELSSFTIMGEIDLRTEKDISSPVKYMKFLIFLPEDMPVFDYEE